MDDVKNVDLSTNIVNETEEPAEAFACMEVAGIESMTNCSAPGVGSPLNQ